MTSIKQKKEAVFSLLCKYISRNWRVKMHSDLTADLSIIYSNLSKSTTLVSCGQSWSDGLEDFILIYLIVVMVCILSERKT